MGTLRKPNPATLLVLSETDDCNSTGRDIRLAKVPGGLLTITESWVREERPGPEIGEWDVHLTRSVSTTFIPTSESEVDRIMRGPGVMFDD